MKQKIKKTVGPIIHHRIHRNHHSHEDSDGVSRHSTGYSAYIAYFLHITLPNENWIPAAIKLKHTS